MRFALLVGAALVAAGLVAEAASQSPGFDPITTRQNSQHLVGVSPVT